MWERKGRRCGSTYAGGEGRWVVEQQEEVDSSAANEQEGQTLCFSVEVHQLTASISSSTST